jgi:hypothetical protein
MEEFWQNMTYEELTTWSLRSVPMRCHTEARLAEWCNETGVLAACRELRIACAARRLPREGRKLDLIDRLMQLKLKVRA